MNARAHATAAHHQAGHWGHWLAAFALLCSPLTVYGLDRDYYVRSLGPDLPPSGRSLFDHLVFQMSGDGGYRVPYPFEKLLDGLEAGLQPHEYFASPVHRLLIPVGRSLQRAAGVADFFVYPRAVVAVDAESASEQGQAGMHLKGRLFIGYHEKAAVLEVISYNETAGRFEFQIVRDYAPNAVPRVFYAKRELCFACHQNGGPIFAKPLWDETNANRNVAARLAETGRDHYGFGSAQGVDIAYAFDAAVDRANLFAVGQRIWQEGCGADGVPGARCRAALLRALLLYRLSDGYMPDATPAQAHRPLADLRERWQRLWPKGLPIANADLPNRKPIASATDVVTATLEVPAAFEPLAHREPSEYWSADEGLAKGIDVLATFLTLEDVRRIDDMLSANPDVPETRYESGCTFRVEPTSKDLESLGVRCGDPGAHGDFELRARIRVRPTPATPGHGEIGKLQLPDSTPVQLAVKAVQVVASRNTLDVSVTPGQRYSPHTARTPAGHAVGRLTFTLDSSQPAADGTFTGTAALTLRDEFQLMDEALQTLLARADGAEDALAAKPFRRAAVMRSLLHALGAEPLQWCCESESLPPPAVTPTTVPAFEETAAPALAHLYSYCGACHATDDPFPPNFLTGTPSQVRTKLKQCAARMLQRMSMWAQQPARREKSPMPPASALRVWGLDAAYWPKHEHFTAIQAYVAKLGGARGHQGEALPACLPAVN